ISQMLSSMMCGSAKCVVSACQSATKKKHSYSCCNFIQLWMTPWRCPRCSLPMGRMPDSTRRCESIELKPYSRARPPSNQLYLHRISVLQAPGTSQGGDYSGNALRVVEMKVAGLQKGGRISLALAKNAWNALFEVDHRGGFASAKTGIHDNVDL